jgi:hypothetical protein
LSVPLNLGDLFNANNGESAFGDPSSSLPASRSQQWDAAAMLRRTQDELTNIRRQQQQLQNQQQQNTTVPSNIQSFALQPPPASLFHTNLSNTNTISSLPNHNLSHVGNIANTADTGTGGGGGGGGGLGVIDYSMPLLEQQMLPTIIGSRPLSLGGQNDESNHNNNQLDDLFNGSSPTNPFDTFNLQKYATQQQQLLQQSQLGQADLQQQLLNHLQQQNAHFNN